jgi:hypothetical protein
MVDPSYFHLFTGNKLINCRMGIYNGSPHVEQDKGTAMMAAVYRKNTVQAIVSGVQNDTKYASSPVFKAFVYESNSFLAPSGFQTGSMYQQNPDIDYGSGAWENHVFYKNSFSGSASAIRVTPKVVLRENSYQGFSSLYKGTLSAVVEAPFHVVEINAPPKDTLIKLPFTLVNAGSAAMNWTATSNAAWLKLSAVSGKIKAEKNSTIALIISSKKMDQGKHTTELNISSLGKTKKYLITVKVSKSTQY